MTSSTFDILPSYIQDLYNHQIHTQNHLKGHISAESPLPPSFFPPSSYWTSAEKDLFFHGLTIYSRLRPELIAEHIKTKSTYDVCLYLDALQLAAEQDPSPTHVTYHEPALDVSTRWIDYEESLAAELISRDVCIANIERAGLRESCSCPEEQHQWEGITGHETKECKAVLNHIDRSSLQVMDTILKDAEDERTATASESGYNSSRHGTVNPSGAEDERSNRSASVALDEDEDATEQDPKARRRLLKRLYMRRKRAEKLGRELDLRAEKLRPGRASRSGNPPKPKPRPKSYKPRDKGASRATSVVSDAGDVDISAPGSSASNTPIPDTTTGDQHEGYKRGGLTRRYRVKELFLQSGIDSDALHNAELDLFAFSGLSRALDKNQETPFAGSVSISALWMMKAVLKQFLSDVIRCLVITKEQENRLKGKLKVWKNDEEEITVENVAECLHVLGFQISADDSENVSNSSDVRDQGNEPNRNAGDTTEQYQSIILSSIPVHCILHPPDDDKPTIDDETDTEEFERDKQQNDDDEKASVLFERELWKTVC